MLSYIDSDMAKQGYSILIIGINSHPSHIVRFIRNLKLVNPSVRISLLTNREPAVYPDEIHDYIEDFLKWRRTSRWEWWPLMNRLINAVSSSLQIRRLAKTMHFDIINIHFPQYYFCYLMGYLKKMGTSIIISPWGSDVLRLKGKRKRRLLARVFQKADFVTVGPKGDIGNALVNEMKVASDKFYPLSWGSETIDFINEHGHDVSPEEAKLKLGLENRYVITCGYNAFEAQRHEIMIDAIREIKSQLLPNLILLFPVTYGSAFGTRKNDYVERLKGLCREYDLDALFYEDYLSVAELFYLRQATDMFIHIQTTDGGNSSLQEYVLLGKKVVHGSWIHYSHLERFKPLFYFPVDSIDHLSEVVLSTYYSKNIETPPEVLEYIRNRGWKAKMVLWNNFFASIV